MLFSRLNVLLKYAQIEVSLVTFGVTFIMEDDLCLNLTERGKDYAKKFVLNVLLKGTQSSEKCDTELSVETFQIPDFYDKTKFLRGQKYYADNRFGILVSNLCGLFSLICEPNGAKLLDRTNNSSSPSSARKRYVRTILDVHSWCTEELIQGSRSWKSLKKVRKMHLAASSASLEGGSLGISQMFMSFTTFGFMGYALVKPQLLGIKNDCDEDREAYVHMWAIITSMLGIKDEFNMCLHRLEVVEIICHILIRYFFNPLLQMETKIFQKLGYALCDGLKFHIPFLSYNWCLFLTRRLAGIPGYQLDIHISTKFRLRQIFTKSELEKIRAKYQSIKGFEYCRDLIFSDKIRIIQVRRMSEFENAKELTNFSDDEIDDQKRIIMDLLELKYPDELEIIEVDDEDARTFFDEKKFKTLPRSDRYLVNLMILSLKSSKTFIAKHMTELSLSVILKIMKLFESKYNNFN